MAAMKVTMEIPATRASLVAQFFIDEGFEVSWEAPLEKRASGFENELVQIIFWLKDSVANALVGGAAVTAAQNAISRVRERFPTVKTKIDVED